MTIPPEAHLGVTHCRADVRNMCMNLSTLTHSITHSIHTHTLCHPCLYGCGFVHWWMLEEEGSNFELLPQSWDQGIVQNVLVVPFTGTKRPNPAAEKQPHTITPPSANLYLEKCCQVPFSLRLHNIGKNLHDNVCYLWFTMSTSLKPSISSPLK